VDLNGKSGTALDLEDLAEELRFALDELEQVSERLERIRKKLEAQMTKLDPKGILTSIPGVGIVTAAACLVALGTHEFRNAKAFRSYTGLVPRVSESGQSRSRGLSLTKAGPVWFRTALYLAADVARRWDPELAAIYQRAMVTKAHPHRKAVCAVAAHLAGRVWAVWRDQRPYEVRDLHGRPITPQEARVVIDADLAVPEEIRARLRKARPAATRPAKKSKEAWPPPERAGAVQRTPQAAHAS
jgi:hypothetical protein